MMSGVCVFFYFPSMWLCMTAALYYFVPFARRGSSDSCLSRFLFVFADADDFVPLPPVSAKDEPKTTSQWDDEEVEDELKEEAKPEPVRSVFNL